MNRKLLTLDDLYNFYVAKGESCTFSALGEEDSIVVHIDETMSFDSDYDPQLGLLKTHLKSCHLYRNRNTSSISKESMLQAIPSFYNRPILGKIHKLSDGSYDFAGHEMKVDQDGNIEFEEIPVGVIPESCNAQLVYDEEKDKTYLEVDGYIFEEYTRAADILREKGECKVSIEISVEEMSYSAQDKVLNIDKFHFLGVTILGCTDDEYEIPIEGGMYGSNITIAEFSAANNSVITTHYEAAANIAKILEEINEKISKLSAKNFGEGGNTPLKLQELLDKYGKTVDDLDFDYENMSDEELEAKFEELFGCKKKKKCTIEANDKEYVFEISMDDKVRALEILVNDTYSEQDNAYYCVKVYEKYVVMIDYWTGHAFKQDYKSENDVFSLVGDRVEVYCTYLTKEEETAIDEMRANYSSIQERLGSYEKAEMNAKREEILNAEAYSVLAENADFIELKKNMENYNLEDLSKEADLIFAKHVKESKSFSFAADPNSDPKPDTSKNTSRFFSSSSHSDDETRKPYNGFIEEFYKKNKK